MGESRKGIVATPRGISRLVLPGSWPALASADQKIAFAFTFARISSSSSSYSETQGSGLAYLLIGGHFVRPCNRAQIDRLPSLSVANVLPVMSSILISFFAYVHLDLPIGYEHDDESTYEDADLEK